MSIFLACLSNPCANGGQCFSRQDNKDYYCQCPPNLPLGGKNCDQLIITTTIRPRQL